MALHNSTGRAVPRTSLLLDSQLTIDLISNSKILVNTRKVRGKEVIRGHCNSRVKIVERVSNLPGYGTVWYKPTGISNTLLMLRATKKFWVVFNIEGKIFQDGPPGQRSEVPANPYRDILF